MCQLWRRIVAAVLLTGGMVGCATLPDSVAGRHGVATASIMPAVHWSLEKEAGRMDSVDPGIRLIPTEIDPSSSETSTELLSAEVSL